MSKLTEENKKLVQDIVNVSDKVDNMNRSSFELVESLNELRSEMLKLAARLDSHINDNIVSTK